MIHPEARPVTVSEGDVAGRFLVANHESDRVHVQADTIDEGMKRYTVTGEIALERQAIAAIMARPLDRSGAPWDEVRDGLRDISYPTRQVRALARGALGSDLRAVGPASRQLAQQLTDNQDQRTQTANVPVFSFFESYDYVVDQARRSTDPAKLINYLKGLGMEFETARRFQALLKSDETNVENARALRELLGIDDQDALEIFNRAVLGSVDHSVEAELLYRLQELSFTGFRQQASFSHETVEGGGRDYEIFLRNRDIPESLKHRIDATRVTLGPKLADADRETGQRRHKIHFSTQAARVITHPQLIWENHHGKRLFRFGVNPYRKQEEWRHKDRPEKPSSLVGAALVINYLAGVKGIDYAGELESRKRRALRSGKVVGELTSIPEAGLLPLVITHRQSELLDDEYFDAMEAVTK